MIAAKQDARGRTVGFRVSTEAEGRAVDAAITADLITRVAKTRQMDGHLYITPMDGDVLERALLDFLNVIVATSAKDAALTPTEDTSREP